MAIGNLERWKSAQIAAAVERGVNPLDAAKSMEQFLSTLPAGADPETYIRPARELEEVLPTEAVIADARAAWYADVDARYARILDARQSE